MTGNKKAAPGAANTESGKGKPTIFSIAIKGSSVKRGGVGNAE